MSDGFKMRYRFPTADDGVVRTTVFHIVEQIGEVTGRISSSDIWHGIRLSDFEPNVNPKATRTTNHWTTTIVSSNRASTYVIRLRWTP